MLGSRCCFRCLRLLYPRLVTVQVSRLQPMRPHLSLPAHGTFVYAAGTRSLHIGRNHRGDAWGFEEVLTRSLQMRWTRWRQVNCFRRESFAASCRLVLVLQRFCAEQSA